MSRVASLYETPKVGVGANKYASSASPGLKSAARRAFSLRFAQFLAQIMLDRAPR
jgi:hypothetical protein